MTPTAQEIETWIAQQLAEHTKVSPDEVDVRMPLTRLGLDSVTAIAVVADLEKWLGYRFHENPLEAHGTIEKLARFLADEIQHSARNEADNRIAE